MRGVSEVLQNYGSLNVARDGQINTNFDGQRCVRGMKLLTIFRSIASNVKIKIFNSNNSKSQVTVEVKINTPKLQTWHGLAYNYRSTSTRLDTSIYCMLVCLVWPVVLS